MKTINCYSYSLLYLLSVIKTMKFSVCGLYMFRLFSLLTLERNRFNQHVLLQGQPYKKKTCMMTKKNKDVLLVMCLKENF